MDDVKFCPCIPTCLVMNIHILSRNVIKGYIKIKVFYYNSYLNDKSFQYSLGKDHTVFIAFHQDVYNKKSNGLATFTRETL